MTLTSAPPSAAPTASGQVATAGAVPTSTASGDGQAFARHGAALKVTSDARDYNPEGLLWSYGEVAERVTRLIERYVAAGYGHGHRVSLLLENRPEFMLHFLALNAVGCWVVPLNPEFRHDDLSYVLGAAKDIAKLVKEYKVIVTKSTVPVGTADKVTAVLKANTDVECAVVSNPEFLREGVAVDDFMKPDRVVVGTMDERARKLMGELYAPYVRQGNPIIFMDERSSELTKYAANSFLAMKITFINEMADLCERVNADVHDVARGIGLDGRIGRKFLQMGPLASLRADPSTCHQPERSAQRCLPLGHISGGA